MGIEQVRLRELQPAVARRVVRAAARRLGARLSFDQTEQILAMTEPAMTEDGREPRRGKFDLPDGITVERSLREIRLTKIRMTRVAGQAPQAANPAYEFRIPGEIRAPAYGVCLHATFVPAADVEGQPATLRPWKPGDRVTLRHSRGPKKVAEVLDRLHVLGSARKSWLVVECQGRIVWVQGAEVDAPGFTFTCRPLTVTGLE